MCLGFARKIYGIRLTEYQFPVPSTKPQNRSTVIRLTEYQFPVSSTKPENRSTVIRLTEVWGLPAETPKVEFVCM